MPILSSYQGASTEIYFFLSSFHSPTDRHKYSPTSLKDQSSCTIFNHWVILFMDLEKMAKMTDTIVSCLCVTKGAQQLTLLKFAPMELVNYSQQWERLMRGGMLWGGVFSLVSISVCITHILYSFGFVIFTLFIWCPSNIVVTRIYIWPTLTTWCRFSEQDWDQVVRGAPIQHTIYLPTYLPVCRL